MHLLNESDETPVLRRTGATPAEPQNPVTEGTPWPSTLTSIEHRPEFEKLRAGVYQEYAPSNFFRQVLADDIAEEIWMKKRLSDVANQSLSWEIERSYDELSQSHPNIDRALRTVFAWKEFHKDPSCRSALSERTRSARLFLTVMRSLPSLDRRK